MKLYSVLFSIAIGFFCVHASLQAIDFSEKESPVYDQEHRDINEVSLSMLEDARESLDLSCESGKDLVFKQGIYLGEIDELKDDLDDAEFKLGLALASMYMAKEGKK